MVATYFSEFLKLFCVGKQMKMYSKPRKFYKLVYSLVILWCYVMKVNGANDTNVNPLAVDTDTYVEPLVMDNNTYVEPSIVAKNYSNSHLFNILSGNQIERKGNSLDSIMAMNINAGSVNFNIPFTFPGSNSKINDTRCERPIKNVRDDYTLTEGIGYHKLHTRKLDWNTARKACMDENAYLVVVNSIKEANVLYDLMTGRDITSVYIGAHDMFQEGEWITLFGESLERAGYNVWASGEPNNADGNEDCGVIRRGGELNDIPCSSEYNFICEISL